MNDQKTFNSLDSNYFKVMIVKRLIFILIILGVVAFGYFRIEPSKISGLAFILIGCGVLILSAIILFLAKFYFRNKKYRLFDKNLTYQEGVLVHNETVVPFSRIQHVEIDEGPLERYFSLATLSVYTAGDSGKDLKISGLRIDLAQEIKDYITNYIKDE
ncbi:PH domain-containing protein [Flavobacteriales bacterium]|nr:PH domain-containing protein [Flavobacteriales bacterium]MDB9702157.1 PH domain-containing protein [Flavobacteriales bacterium]